jgi:hypothetical protein
MSVFVFILGAGASAHANVASSTYGSHGLGRLCIGTTPRLDVLHSPVKLLPRICIFFGALAFASFAKSAYAAPPTVISSLPFFITVPGKYVLNQNFTLSAATAIIITCGDVTVDLNGYTITGPGDTGHKALGIVVASLGSAALSNIIIKNGTLANLHGGISFFPSTGPVGVTDSVIRDITLMGIPDAISDTKGIDNQIQHCTIIPDANTVQAIQLTNCTDDVIAGNTFHPIPIPLTPPYQSIIIVGTVEGNVVVNNQDVSP